MRKHLRTAAGASRSPPLRHGGPPASSPRAAAAAASAAAPAPGPPRNWPPVAERMLLGKSIKRLDGPDKAQGKAKYTYDLIRPGMLYGEILGSPHPRARVRSIDLSAAKSAARREGGPRRQGSGGSGESQHQLPG